MSTPQPGAVEKAIGAAPVTVRLRGTVGHDATGRIVTGGDVITGDHVTGVTVTRWRQRPDSRPAPATAQIDLSAAAFGPYAAALPDLGDTVAVQLTPQALAWAGLPATDGARWRFLGRVTDADSIPGTPRRPPVVRLVAVGPQANTGAKIGAAPWAAQLDGPRASAILAALVAIEPPSDEFVAVGAVDPGAVQVLAQDIDATPARQLLEDLAADSGGELVELRDGTLVWHDANHRRGAVPVVELWAANIMAAPAWRKQLTGLVNDVTLGYGAASPQATVEVVDTVAADAVGRFDATRATQLATSAAASSRATDLVGRWGRPRWRLEAFTVDLIRTIDPARAAKLLGLTFGQLLAVDGLPAADGTASVARLWVEGATESISRQAWRLQLHASDYGLTGPAPLWADVPTGVTWADVDPSLSWLGAVGWWPGDASAGRWVDVAADLTWADTDPATTWATY